MFGKIFRFIILLILISASYAYSQAVVINEIVSSNSYTIADENGEYPDWLEIYNPGSSVVTLTGFGLSDDPANPLKWVFPSGSIQPHKFLVVFCSGYNRTSDFTHLHTSFKISASGETLSLSDAAGNLIDQVIAPALPPDVSTGRQPDGSSSWFYFSSTTPGTTNNTTGYTGITDPPQFSSAGGFFSGGVTISLSESTPGAVIKYSLNGSEPTMSSASYASPLNINSTMVLRAKAFKTGFINSSITTNTYFINENHNLPVFSISTDSANFFDWNTGIYVLGPNAKKVEPYYGANYWQDWEKPIHIELFEPDGKQGFSIDAGVQIAGGWSRINPEKSLAVFARGKYGYNEIAYKLFPDLPCSSYQSFMLRNGGQDNEGTMMRDEMEQTVLKKTGLDVQDYRPAIVFLNGQYWGIHNLREKESEHYLAQHHGVDPDNLDRLEVDGTVLQGDNINYNNLYNYISSNDMSMQANYDYVKTQMDVDNFISYMVSEIYIDNTDWPGSNIKFWRERIPTGKWNWMVYDTDYGFGLDPAQGYTHDNLAAATATNGPDWPNPPWSTLLLRRLLLNPQFKTDFINKFADYVNTIFDPAKVVNTINTIKAAIAPEMPRHIAKWGGNITDWNNNVDYLNTFAVNRPQYARQHFINKFSLAGTVNFTINVSSQSGGKVQINTVKLDEYPFSGVYFKNIPVKLTAEASNGYSFTGWTGSITASSTEINITPSTDINLTANFVQDGSAMVSPVIFTEINYNASSTSKSDDWVEIYNRSTQPVDISGYNFKDDDNAHNFIFPAGTVMQPNSYLVLCQTASKFTAIFPGVTNYIGSFSFGLSSVSEQVRLFDTDMQIVDSVAFTGTLPWDTLANGKGPTLSLKNPFMDNTIPGNWSASSGHGTPGRQNNNYISRGDVDSNGFVQAYDASIILQEVVGLIPQFDPAGPAFWSADVNQDGMVGAFDASWILSNVIYNKFPDGTLPKRLQASGSLKFGNLNCDNGAGTISIPVNLNEPQNVLSVYAELNISDKDFELLSVEGRKGLGVQSVYNYSGNKLKIALSGLAPFESGNIVTIKIRIKDKNAESNISGSCSLNDYLNSDLGTLAVNSVPAEFKMSQNYPNPFNPSTKIMYQLPGKGHVQLEIYNALGKRVKTLVSREEEGGFYTVDWNGKNDNGYNLPSGIYIYRITSGSFVSVKKMTLIK